MGPGLWLVACAGSAALELSVLEVPAMHVHFACDPIGFSVIISVPGCAYLLLLSTFKVIMLTRYCFCTVLTLQQVRHTCH